MNKNLEMHKRIDSWLDKVKDEYVNDVIGAINIPSISTQTHGKYPFGDDCKKMLDYMETCMRRYGFNYTNHEYYCGTSLIEGTSGKGEIGMFGHVDVVEAGEGWTVEPFCGQEKDGYIVGRGSNDNKGSTFACIYAMRFFKENNIQLKNNVRLLFGCNEEDGMEDVKYYGKKHKFPSITIVPDSWFPISKAEKGALNIVVDAMINSGNLVEFKSGENGTSIPNKAICVITGYTINQIHKVAQNYSNIHTEACQKGIKITATGITKHAAFPEGSINAINVLASFLLKENLLHGDAKLIFNFIAESLADYEGKSLNINLDDNLSGKVTHTIGEANLLENKIRIHFNIRYPALSSVEKEAFYKKCMNYFDKPFLSKVTVKHIPPHTIDTNHPIVDIFCEISSNVYKQQMRPFLQAGETYTGVTPNSFAAGPAIRGREQQLFKQEGHGGAHQPDECMEIEVLLNGIKIYILSILSIDEWLDNKL